MLLRRMDRLVLNEIIGPFIGGTLLFTGLIFAGDSFVRLTQYWQQGVPGDVVLRLFLYTLPGVMSYTFPMAMLLAALLGFMRLANDGELTALIASGARLERIMVPVALFALLVSALGLWLNSDIIPACNRIRQDIIDNVAKHGVIVNNMAFDRAIRADDGSLRFLIHAEGGLETEGIGGRVVLRKVSVETWDRGQAIAFTSAPQAEWVIGTSDWQMSDFTNATLTGETKSVASVHHAQTMTVPIGTPDQIALLQRRVADLTTSELRERAAILRDQKNLPESRDAEVEVARRTALPFASFIFALVGAPLGIRPQRTGRGVGFGISVLITFAYWMGLQFVSVLARAGTLPPDLALMLPNFVGVIAAVILVRSRVR